MSSLKFSHLQPIFKKRNGAHSFRKHVQSFVSTTSSHQPTSAFAGTHAMHLLKKNRDISMRVFCRSRGCFGTSKREIRSGCHAQGRQIVPFIRPLLSNSSPTAVSVCCQVVGARHIILKADLRNMHSPTRTLEPTCRLVVSW